MTWILFKSDPHINNDDGRINWSDLIPVTAFTDERLAAEKCIKANIISKLRVDEHKYQVSLISCRQNAEPTYQIMVRIVGAKPKFDHNRSGDHEYINRHAWLVM